MKKENTGQYEYKKPEITKNMTADEYYELEGYWAALSREEQEKISQGFLDTCVDDDCYFDDELGAYIKESWEGEKFKEDFLDEAALYQHKKAAAKIIGKLSLAKLYRHIKRGEPLVFISAFTKETASADEYGNDELLRTVREYQFGYNKISGGYVGARNEFSREQSVIAYARSDEADELLEFAGYAAELYDQDCVLYVDPQGEAYIYWLRDGFGYFAGGMLHLNDLTAVEICKYYSEIDSHRFAFENGKPVVIGRRHDFSIKKISAAEISGTAHNRNEIRKKLGKPAK